ncbi:hypothetical protein L2E82_00083 [Cichorium intybus]|uniref:Uncharacterized protein n=1 Tax=Cichorium intybus TaxID=13427 RepID=A0ACB9GVT2_CICIN|nr:hypothetical protein L2E82_00083 [Cichorium intybus]
MYVFFSLSQFFSSNRSDYMFPWRCLRFVSTHASVAHAIWDFDWYNCGRGNWCQSCNYKHIDFQVSIFLPYCSTMDTSILSSLCGEQRLPQELLYRTKAMLKAGLKQERVLREDEVGLKQCLEMLEIFKSYSTKTSLLDDLSFYGNREKMLKAKRISKAAFQTEKNSKSGEMMIGEGSMNDPTSSLINLTRNLSINSNTPKASIGDKSLQRLHNLKTFNHLDAIKSLSRILLSTLEEQLQFKLNPNMKEITKEGSGSLTSSETSSPLFIFGNRKGNCNHLQVFRV